MATEQHRPGRELDAAVHRALWPDADIRVDSTFGAALVVNADKRTFSDIPEYSSDLMTWDGVRDDLGWWEASEAAQLVQVYWRLMPYDGQYIYADAYYRDHDDNRFRAQAFARCLCVLQWAERRAEE